jgi:hypothetical protein
MESERDVLPKKCTGPAYDRRIRDPYSYVLKPDE